MDFATRAYNHSFPFDPIVRSLLDTDFYKLLMQQFIWEHYPNEQVAWSLTNRTRGVRLGELIDAAALRQQLDHVRTLRFTPSEIIYLRGQSFYGQTGIFKHGYLDALRTFHLPDYHMEQSEDGQLHLTFDGPWWQTTMWEIYALAIVNEMRSRALLKTMSRSELDILYARAKVKLWAKLERLAALPDLNLSDFGTRRRHGFLWQEHCIVTARELLGPRFTGTSNVYLAMKHGREAKGTNAHELPMVLAALEQVLWPDHCIQGSPGAAFNPGIERTVARANLIIRKGANPAVDSYSAFFENDHVTPTGLAGYLREKEVGRCVFVGLAYDFCVAWSALDARRLGLQAVVVKPLTRAIAMPAEGGAGTTADLAETRFLEAGVTLAA